jgi:DtxR family Mn-dependent transcriptional regulator
MRIAKGIEDYLEAIYLLGLKSSSVRVKDIAQFLKVKPPSVTEALSRLAEEGLVEHTPYGEVQLTVKGKKTGMVTWGKHQLLFEFLRDVLGVSEEVAFKEACLLEHDISDETKGKIKEFLERLKYTLF